MSRPVFRVGECVQLLDRQGIPYAAHYIDRIEYDAEGRLWAGFIMETGKPGDQCFHVSEDRMTHRDRETGDE